MVHTYTEYRIRGHVEGYDNTWQGCSAVTCASKNPARQHQPLHDDTYAAIHILERWRPLA